MNGTNARVSVPGVHFWTPNGLQTGMLVEGGGYKSLKKLVGPRGFEPRTSCTPSKRASQAAPRPELFILSQRRAGKMPPRLFLLPAAGELRCLQPRLGAFQGVQGARDIDVPGGIEEPLVGAL